MKKSSKICSSIFAVLRRNLLLILLLTGLAVGIAMGIGMRSNSAVQNWGKREHMYFRFPGDLLMRMLKALVIPLIVSSLICGMAGLDASSSGRMGLCAIIYYLSTTLIAVLEGILMVTTIRPGFRSKVEIPEMTGTAESANMVDSFLDLIRNIFPDNIVEASFRQTRTKQIAMVTYENSTNTSVHCNQTDFCTTNVSKVYYDFAVVKEDGVNALGLVVFSLALGVAVGKLKEVGKPLYAVCVSLADATMKLVTAVIWYSPIGIAFLIASEILLMEDPIKDLEALAWYIVTVLAGLSLHSFVVLPLIYLIVVKKNPLTFLNKIVQAFLTAFGTSSSSATLPVTYYCLEEKLKLDRRVTRFILPVGATINMDGTALYEAVAAIFIAQSNGINLNAAQVVAVSITATLASIGAASVPQAGLVTMVIVLSAVGLPAEEVSKILAVDWLLDRFRTTVNVEGDAIGAGIVSHLCRNYLGTNDLDVHSSPTDATNESINEAVIHNNGGLEKNAPKSNEYGCKESAINKKLEFDNHGCTCTASDDTFDDLKLSSKV